MLTRTLILSFLLGSANASFACRPVSRTLLERVEMSESIYAGYVVGEHLSQFEVQVANEQLFQLSHTIVVPESRAFTIHIKESLKGPSLETLIFNSGCGTGSPSLKDRVVVFRNNGFVYSMKLDEQTYNQIKSYVNDDGK